MQRRIKKSIGFIMILATLGVMTLASYLILRDSQRQGLQDIRDKGPALTRILATSPYLQLLENEHDTNTLQLLKLYLSNSNLAYIAITDREGQVINKISVENIELPKSVPATGQPLWLDEQKLTLNNTTIGILEYSAPLLNNGELAAYVRTGFYIPQWDIAPHTLTLLAQLALVIFLLMLFFYYVLYREMQPLRLANQKICKALNAEKEHQETVPVTGESHDFINNFNRCLSVMQEKTTEVESVKLEAQTSQNLLSYHKRRVESALQTLPDALIVIDGTGRTTFANQKIESLIGISIESVMGNSPAEWCDNDEVVALLSQYHGNLTPLHRTETLKYSPTQYPDKTISVSVYPLFLPEDAHNMLGILVLFRDISEQILASRSRDDFVAHVSHELKSPLNVIGMHAELMLEEDQKDPNDYINNMNVIIDEVERLSNLINDLLNVTKFESGNISLNRQRIKMQEFLTDTFVAGVRSSSKKQISTNIDIARSISTLNIDKDLLRIALNNLLSNAIKYTPEGGHVSLTADEIGDTIQIQISDDGIGISSEDQKHIYEKFFRSENEETQQQSGHGLGLAITREIIELHGGEINIKSKSNEGTTFTVTFMKTSEILKEAI